MYLCNAFSLNMLKELNVDIAVRPIEIEDVKDFHADEELQSAVGHPDTAALFSALLGFIVPALRINLALEPGDRLIVGQYRGPRLAPGTTELPPGTTIEWALIVIKKGRY